MKHSCLIVEDEPLAQKVLQQYISDHPQLTLTATCDDAFAAQQVLSSATVDIIFLDINLPRLSGINFLKTLARKPQVIFTTAYPEHAIEGFELDAADYLVKPFSFERFLKAVNKAIQAQRIGTQAPVDGFIFIKSGKKVFRVPVNEIWDLEAVGDYVKVRMLHTQQLVNSTLKDLLEQLPQQLFLRIHKSFAIARNKIEFIEGNYVRIGGRDVPIGATYREEFLNSLNSK